jgi:hypothetical protein
MDVSRLADLVKKLDREAQMRLYLKLAHQLTIRARETYASDPAIAKQTLEGINELQHKLLGQVSALMVDAKRYPDETFVRVIFGTAEQRGIGLHLALALQAVAETMFAKTPY